MRRIVLGFDDSQAARAARGWASDQARRTGAELHVVYVSSSTMEWELAAAQIDPDPIRREARRRLEHEWTAPLRADGVPYRTTLTVGRPAEELMRIARREAADLIVVGMTGRGTIGELLFGSIVHELGHHAVRPVVAVPASWDPAPANLRDC